MKSSQRGLISTSFWSVLANLDAHMEVYLKFGLSYLNCDPHAWWGNMLEDCNVLLPWGEELLISHVDPTIKRNFFIITICCNLAIATHGKKMQKETILAVNRRGLAIICPKHHNQQPLIDNQNDIFMHFVVMNQVGEVQQIIVMDKFSGSICDCYFKLDVYTLLIFLMEIWILLFAASHVHMCASFKCMWNVKLGVKQGISSTIVMTKSYGSLFESCMEIFTSHTLPHLRSPNSYFVAICHSTNTKLITPIFTKKWS